MKKLLPLLLLLWFLPAVRAQALQAAEPGPKVYGYVMWTDQHLLFAARVEDSILSATSSEPQVFPANDDGIELGLEVPGAQGRTAYRLAISAADGFAILKREEGGRWRTDNSWLQPPATLKFAVALEGTLNNPSDKDRGFTVEVAIPWERLGGTPKPMTAIGFNFLARIRGENQTFVSWAPGVVSEEDNADSSRWGAMLLFPGGRPSAAEPGVLICPRSLRVPLVDGKLGAEEWIGASVLTLQKPLPEFQPSPETARRHAEIPLLMALYRYAYPPETTTASYQPRPGLGPWASAARTGWHREQLREIQRAGIEVLLAAYSPTPAARKDWARTGLVALTEALKELRAAGRSYPLVGMYLDTAGLAQTLGKDADLTTLRAQQILYGSIREFYQHLPPEFRAEIGASPGERGYVVALGPPKGLVAWDSGFIAYANQAFARDFGGAKLLWLADPAWKSREVTGIHAYPSFSGEQSSTHDATGQAAAAALSPGYDDPAAGISRPRSEASEVREEWKRMLALDPAYMVIVSWNDFARSTQIAPSRQEGFTLVDAFSQLVSQEADKADRPVRLRKVNLPPAIAPGGSAQAEITLANTSSERINTDEWVRFDLRILDENGKLTVASKNGVADFRLPPGGIAQVSVPITARDVNNKPLAAGRYVVEFSLLRSPVAYLRSRWLARTLASFRLPLLVERPPDQAYCVLGSTLRSHLQSGAKYTAALTLRNDGAKPWKKQNARVFYQWQRLQDDLEAATSQQAEMLEPRGLATSLPRDVQPGETITLRVEVETTAQGRPLAPWNPGDMWHYGLSWRLEAAGKEAPPARGAGSEAIYVVSADPGSRFVDSTSPAEMTAGQEYPVRLALTNAGPEAWSPEKTAAIYHWFNWDGTPAQLEAGSTPLPEEAKPGGSAQLTAAVKAPRYGGPYYLLWDLKVGETLASAANGGRSDDTLLVPVMVQGGPCQQVDLTKYFNVIAATSDRRRSSGDFDGLGNTFPAESLPPDLSGDSLEVYPSGYYTTPAFSAGLKQITFRYPPKSGGLAKALACRGQSIALSGGMAARLHILGAGTGAGLSGSVTVAFADGHTESHPLTMSSWLEAPSHGEAEGFVAPHLHTPRGDNPSQPVHLHHYVLPLSQPSEVTSILLPDNPEMKIFAITLESLPSE